MNFSFTRHGRALLLAAATVVIGTQTAYAQQPRNYTGNGGKGISLTVYVPQSTGLEKNRSYIPALVQGEFVSNFSNYSAISVLVDEAYDDKAEAKQDVVLGRLAPTSHFLTGSITKTKTGYNIKANITATADKMTAATYTGTFSFAELDNLTGVRRASLELLQKVGVELTENARLELAGAATANQVSAQTAFAKGVTARRAGTEVVALSYYYQAASFNPAMKEAVKRSSVMAANISSGNIGVDLRNDILWRKKWVAKLQETEEAFYEMIKIEAAAPPYSLIYFTDITTGNVSYQMESADLSITTALVANSAWFNATRMAFGAARAVMDGLNSTKREKDWGLAGWPMEGVTETNPFNRSKEYEIKVAFELVNRQGRVIGSQTLGLNPEFRIDGTAVKFSEFTFNPVIFEGVKANDISDNLTIRIASVNGTSPQQVGFAIMPIVEKSQPLTDNRDGKRYKTVKIAGTTWMVENLNYQTSSGSWCYDNNSSNCGKYGRLYDWNTAKAVCPTGWHLPFRWEWDYLASLTGGEKAGKRLKAKSGWKGNGNGTDEYGFSALPGGICSPSGGSLSLGVGVSGFWWSATESGSSNAYYRIMTYDGGNVLEGYDSKSDGYSVRCVADNRSIPIAASSWSAGW